MVEVDYTSNNKLRVAKMISGNIFYYFIIPL